MDPEIKLLRACDMFKTAMYKKLLFKMKMGYGGWDQKSMRGIIGKKLQEHIKRGFKDQKNIIDTANLLMMLWHQREEEASCNKATE